MARTGKAVGAPRHSPSLSTMSPRDRERVAVDHRHMTDVEALMWTVEQDPHLSANFASITILDTLPDMGKLRRRMLRTVQRVPRLRQRVVPGIGRLAPPEWHDDPDFDIDFHIRHLALPDPGDRRTLFDLVTVLVLDPFERTRPLWEFIVVEGLEGEKAALVQKMHHTITDGEGGIRMSEQYIDVERDVDDIDEITIIPDTSTQTMGEDWAGDLWSSTTATIGHTWRRTLGMTNRATLNALIALANPAQLPQVGTDFVETGRSALRQLTVNEKCRSPLWTDRSLLRHFDAFDLDFDQVHRTAKAAGVSINDVFVTAMVRGAAAHHERRGSTLDSIRISMPVSTRQGGAGGNAFVPTRVVLPTERLDADGQLATVHALLDRTKHEKAIGIVEQAAGLANLFPTGLLTRLARDQAASVDLTASNLRAAPFDLYISGARIEGTYPVGPLACTAVNATMMSYCGTLNIGVHIDAGAVREPAELVDDLVTAFDELIAESPGT